MANAIKGTTIFVDTTGLVYTGMAKIKQVILTSAAAATTLVLQDGLAAAGAEKVSMASPIGDTRVAGEGARFRTGIFATIGGVGAKAEIQLE